MNGKELIYSAFRNEKLERTPWVPYTGIQVGKFKDYTATELLKDADKLYECLMESHKQYSPDGMPVIFDLQVEAEILDCELLWANDAPPTVKSHPLADSKVIPTKIPTKTEGRIPMILDVMKRMKASVGDTTALYGLACGPFTLASHLRSTNIFMDMYDDPDYVIALLDYCADVFIAMSDYFIEAGMDVIGAVDPLVSQISPDSFAEFISAPYKKIFDHLREKETLSSFFVCGDATKNLAVMCETGADCLSIDENIDLVAAKKVTDKYGKVLSGNIQLTVCMLLGNQKDCQKAAIEKIDQMGDSNFILAPGCDMPYDTPIENVIGIGQAVQDVENTRTFLESYVRDDLNFDIEMPDYENLDKIMIEVLTIDSATCAACGYMKAAADDMTAIFGDKVEIIERKITEKENIIRLGKLGVANLPTICINGDVEFISLIPNRDELSKAINMKL
ncbi:MAG: uroporphyrinogen decarboxylase family protein [Spirochaetaceae bacterium]